MQWLAEICVHRPVFATVIVMFLTVVGGFSFFTLGVDRFPKIDLPTVSIRTSNPGAAPEEIESEITDVIEGALNTVPGVEEMRSSSSRGSSNVTLTFNLEKDPDQAYQEIQQKLSTVVSRLPETADPPVAQKADPDSQPILMYTVSAPREVMELTELVENLIQERIESADGVGEVFMWGSRVKQVKIFVDPNRLRAFNLAVTEVSNAIRSQNQELPGGNLIEGSRTLGLRTMSKLTDVDQFNDIVITTRNGFPVKIRDIGRVEVSGSDPSSAASLDGVQSVSIGIRKQSGANTIAVINNVKQRMATIIPNLPSDMRVAIIRDQSEFIENSLHAIEEHLVLGGLFAAIVVFLFLWNFRSTIIAALAIPVSIIAAFAAIAALGYSLNQMTMLALTLMVGIVIDDAIVVLENIYRFVEEKGMSPFQAAIEGTREIGLAVLATTLSLLAVFLPVGFMSGIVGRFMSSFGLTAAAAIAVSLVVSFTLTPMLAARWIKSPEEDGDLGRPGEGERGRQGEGEKGRYGDAESEVSDAERYDAESDEIRDPQSEIRNNSKAGWFYRKIDGGYTWLLKLAMSYRWAVVLICVVTVISIFPLYKFVGMAFLPEEDESLYQINVRGPQGTSLSATQSILDRIAREVRAKMPEVKNTLVLAGFGRGSGPNNGFVNVSLKPVSERSRGQAELINQTRQLVKNLNISPKDYQISVSASSSIAGSIGLGRGGSGVGVYIAGPDMVKLTEYANALVEKMKADPIFRDPDTSVEVGSPEIRVVIDRTKAADLGVRAGDVAQALNILAAGQIVSTFSEGSEQFDVVVQADEQYRRDRSYLPQFSVSSTNIGRATQPGNANASNQGGNSNGATPSGGAVGTVPLDRVVKLTEGLSPSSINRLNRLRQVTVSASLPPNSSESDAVAKIQEYAAQLQMPPEYLTGVTGQSKELQKAYDAFLYAFLLSFVFMYLILAAQFESFIHPVTILLTLPLSVPFALLSTAIAGQTLNIFSALGILLLFGIVKKNAILQIDHTNTLRAKGMGRYDAIIQANRDRLRPILMTTIALVAGMIPLVIGSGAGAATNRSIGILVVGGQSLCLLLTLLAVPVFYSLFDDAGESAFFRGVRAKARDVKTAIFRPVVDRFSRTLSTTGDVRDEDTSEDDGKVSKWPAS